MATEPGRRYDLPVSGMSCAACAVRLEKVLNRLPGVAAQVNFATGKARLTAAPDAADADAVLAAIRKAGFDVAPQVLELGIAGMSCAACAARIEKVVGRLPGAEGSVNFAAETARVRRSLQVPLIRRQPRRNAVRDCRSARRSGPVPRARNPARAFR